jgi:hypothetical protein
MNSNKVRNSNFEKTFKEPFGKEDLQHGFERANARRVAEQSRGLTDNTGINLETGGSPANNTDVLIEKLDATIRDAKDAVSLDVRAKRDRIAKEQSLQRQRDRIEKSKAIERSEPSQGLRR